MKSGALSNADIDSLEEVAVIKTDNEEFLFVTFVVGTANLSAFRISGRSNTNGGWAILASAAGDYTSPSGVVIDASGDLTVAAFGSTVHWVMIRCSGMESVRIEAAGTSSTLTGHFRASGGES